MWSGRELDIYGTNYLYLAVVSLASGLLSSRQQSAMEKETFMAPSLTNSVEASNPERVSPARQSAGNFSKLPEPCIYIKTLYIYQSVRVTLYIY